MNCSAAANRDDDLEFVALEQALGAKRAARDDLAVPFQRDALAGQSHLVDDAGNGCIGGKLARFAIDADGDHFAMLSVVESAPQFYYRRV